MHHSFSYYSFCFHVQQSPLLLVNILTCQTATFDIFLKCMLSTRDMIFMFQQGEKCRTLEHYAI